MRIKTSDLVRQTAGSLTVVLGLLLATTAVAKDLNPRLVGSFETADESGNGSALSVAVSGTVAYVSTYGSGLQILDIINPAAPTKLGSYSPASNWRIVWRVAVANDYAYLCDEEVGLVVLDVTDPAAPRRVGGYKPTGPGSKIATAYDVFLSGKYAYVAAGQGGLVVLDVSNPASPRWVGGLDLPGEVHGVVVSGNHAYLADRFLNEAYTKPGVLRIVDISDPTSPQPVANHTVEGEAYSLAIADGIAYVATTTGGAALELIDVSDPTTPKGIGSHAPTGFPVILGDRAVVGSLEVLDISNPAAPRRLGGYPSGGFYQGSVVVEGHYAYVAAGGWGLQIIDLQPEANLARVGHLDMSSAALSIALAGTRAYLTDTSPGLQIIDVGDPRNPAPLGSYPSSYVGTVTVSGNYVRLFEVWRDASYRSYSWLGILDASNPTSPQWVGSYDQSDHTVLGNTASDDYAYLVSRTYDPSYDGFWHGQIEVIDLRTLTNPQPVGWYTNDVAVHVALYGQMLLATGADGLRVLDVSDPANIQSVGSYTNTGSGDILCLATAGTRAYAVSSSAGLLVLDLSDPTQPKLMGSKADPNLPGWGGRLVISGNLVYGAAGSRGVQVFDVSDPAQPRYAGGSSAVVANDLAISGNHLFVASDWDGLQVFDLALSNPESPPAIGITRSGSTLAITWPASAAGAVLETTSEFAPTANWSTEPTVPAAIGDRNVVTLEVGSGPRFFRLRKP